MPVFDFPNSFPLKFLKLPVPVKDEVNGLVVYVRLFTFNFVKKLPTLTEPEKLPVLQLPVKNE